jgi:hypothetical protein
MISQAEVIKVARAMLDQPSIGSQLRRKTKNEYQAVSWARMIVRYILENERLGGGAETAISSRKSGSRILAP